MMNNTNHSSAFYSGATRYGGSSAIAKRREAARKAFFAIKEGPSTSNKILNNTNGTNMMHLYTINSQDIVRQEPPVPQLSSSAKRFFSWIEENSTAQQDTMLSKRRKIRNRFNPMPLRAPIIRSETNLIKPLQPPQPTPQLQTQSQLQTQPLLQQQPQQQLQQHSQQQLQQHSQQQLQTQLQPSSSSSSPLKPLQPLQQQQRPSTSQPPPLPQQELLAPTAPKSTRFKSAQYRGPSGKVAVYSCNARAFAKPRNLQPPPKESPIKLNVEAPVVSPLRLAVNSPDAPSSTKVDQCPPQIVEPAKPARAKAVELTDSMEVEVESLSALKQRTPQQKQDSVPRAPNSAVLMPPPPSFTSSVFQATSTPTFQVVSNSMPDLSPIKQQTKPAFVAPIAPKSTRFKSAQYRGPSGKVAVYSCNARAFAKPRNLQPPPKESPIKLNVEAPVVSPLRLAVNSPDAPSSTKVDQCPPQIVEPVKPVKSPVVELSDSMDVEMESPPQQRQPQQQDSVSETPTSVVLMPPPPNFTNSGFQATSTPTFQAPPAPSFSTSSFQMPSSFTPPVFTPPTIPPVGDMSSPATSSNPFAPAASSTVRGRKILRPVRPSRRLR